MVVIEFTLNCNNDLFHICDIDIEKEKELAFKQYQSLETINKLLKAQVRRDTSINEIF